MDSTGRRRQSELLGIRDVACGATAPAMRTSEDEIVRGTGWPVAPWDTQKELSRGKATGVAVLRGLSPLCASCTAPSIFLQSRP